MSTELQVYKNQQKLQMWAERVKACKSSGMKVDEWCAANNISKYTYYEWQRKVFDAARMESEQVRFVEIREGALSSDVIARIRKPGYDIEILSADALARILSC